MDNKIAQAHPAMKLVAPVYMPFELRVVVWNVEDLMFDGKIKTKSPLVQLSLVRGDYKIEGKRYPLKGATDTHSRSKDGKASFNWRTKFKILCPAPERRQPKLQIG